LSEPFGELRLAQPAVVRKLERLPLGVGEVAQCLLHGVLGERLVAQDAQREPVGGASVAVVQLGERRLLRAGGEQDERFVGQMGELPVQSDRYSLVGRCWFKRSNRFTRSSESAPTAFPHGGVGRREGATHGTPE
jgi:hypothetical protein